MLLAYEHIGVGFLLICIFPLCSVGWLLRTSLCAPCGSTHLFHLLDTSEETILSSEGALVISIRSSSVIFCIACAVGPECNVW